MRLHNTRRLHGFLSYGKLSVGSDDRYVPMALQYVKGTVRRGLVLRGPTGRSKSWRMFGTLDGRSHRTINTTIGRRGRLMQRPEQHPTPDARRHSSSAGIRIRYLLGMLSSYVAASADVIAILRLLAGSQVHVVAAVAIAMAGAVIAIGAGVATLSSTLAWYRVGARPTLAQRTRALTLPSRHARLHGAIWAAVGTATLAVHHDAGARVLILIGTSMILGGAATCCMGYLLAQRILRPLLAAALTEDVYPRRRRHGVGIRLLVAWALCTAIPLVGTAAIVVSARIGWPIQAGADISTPVLVLTGVSVVAGLRGMTLAARSVAEPVREVTEAMGRVSAGQYNVRTLVYDNSEIGMLQSGFNDMAAGIAERERLRDLFGRHVGRDVAQHALQIGTAFTGNVCQAGVVFVDLAGSTALAANNPPDRVAAVLNAFFRIVVDVIDNHGGYVNKFEGDAALAVFGVPLTLDDPAGKALTAARSLRDALKAHRDVPDFGIGVTHGWVFAGNIGAEGRYEYTVIGDPVNEAARLSDLAKNRAGRLLASASAVSDGGLAEGMHWRVGGDVMLRGRRQPTTLAEAADQIP